MKTIIIIPYRNRESHLNYYLEHSLPKLNEVIPNLEVIVVEQSEGKRFNRGATINIGYDYFKQDDYRYITQDVDVNPICDEAINFYTHNVEHDKFLGIYSDGGTLGGVVKFSGKTFRKVNGFPNNYWGWGHEDKELQNRAEHYNCRIEKLIKFHEFEKKKDFFLIFEDNHLREESGKWFEAYKGFDKFPQQIQRMSIIGNCLINLNYKILEEKMLCRNVRKVKVEIL